jgi:FixJ family two-component response regulator
MGINKQLIVIVDDNDFVRDQLAQSLMLMGYDVVSYKDGQSFLSCYVEMIPSVIILDMRMPKLSGLQIQQTIIKTDQKIPIIFMSGESEPQEIIDAMKLGAVDFILKPFEIEDMINAIRRAIDLNMAKT